jgi:hypothetical protein
MADRMDSAYLQEGGFSQAKQRRNQRLTDNHGRKYFATIEIRSGDPVGPVQPMFQAPLAVPPMYMRKHPDPDRPNEVVIDYRRWITDIEGAHTDWEKRGRELSRKTFGSAYDPTQPAFKQEILDLLGERPQPVEPVYAAMQGNRWVLGFTRIVDARLERFFTPAQLNPQAIDFSKYDFRDEIGAGGESEWSAAETSSTEVVEDLSVGSSAAEFDYDAAAAAAGDDGLDDLEMKLDEDEALERQFDREHTGGQRVPVGRSPKGRTPEPLRPSTRHPSAEAAETSRTKATSRAKRKPRAKRAAPTPQSAPS